MIIRLAVAIAAAAIACATAPLSAQEVEWGGHAKHQFTYSRYGDDLYNLIGPQHAFDNSLDLRLNLSQRRAQFEFEVQGEVLAAAGDNVEQTKSLRNDPRFASFPRREGILDDDRRLFRLTESLVDDEEADAVARFDRLSAAYYSEQYVARLGRQAISWGNGVAFQVLDPFNPFSPTEIDKDYKTGDDMLYQQVLLEGGEDLQILYVPRRDLENDDVESSESSYASKFRGRIDPLALGYDLVLARHYNDWLYGAGINRDMLEATWRLDLLLTELDEGEEVVSVVANVDRSWGVYDYNVYTFLEYFRSGVGESSPPYEGLPASLTDRIERGELFTLGTDYIALGGQIELDPRVNLYLSDIANLHDWSGIAQCRVIVDMMQDFLVTVGTNIPYGAPDTEFGGIRIVEADTFLAAPLQVYMRLSYFY